MESQEEIAVGEQLSLDIIAMLQTKDISTDLAIMTCVNTALVLTKLTKNQTMSAACSTLIVILSQIQMAELKALKT